MPKTTNRDIYLTNKDLLAEYNACIEIGEASEKLAQMFWLLSRRLSGKPNFRNYSFREDMIQDAVLLLLERWKAFDPTWAQRNGKTPNPFSYYTQIAYNSMRASIKRHKKLQLCRDEYAKELGIDLVSWNDETWRE